MGFTTMLPHYEGGYALKYLYTFCSGDRKDRASALPMRSFQSIDCNYRLHLRIKCDGLLTIVLLKVVETSSQWISNVGQFPSGRVGLGTDLIARLRLIDSGYVRLSHVTPSNINLRLSLSNVTTATPARRNFRASCYHDAPRKPQFMASV